MEKRRRILLYGNSVILGTLSSLLRDCPQFEVILLLPPLPGRQRLEEMKPNVIFFDLEADHPEDAFSLLDTCPNLVLIGVSPDTNLVKVWSGRHLRELSTQDLLKVIDEQTKNSPVL